MKYRLFFWFVGCLSAPAFLSTFAAAAVGEELANDVVIAEVPELFKFDNLYEISLGICVVFLFLTLWWLTLLRRKVKEQAEQLKAQFERETVLQKRFKDLFEHANDLVMTIDRSGFVADLNAAGEEILGCPRTKAELIRFTSFLDDDHIRLFEQWAEECSRNKGKAFEAFVRGAHGKRAILELM